MYYGEKMLDFRAKHNLTQKKFAEILGINQSYICRYECGLYNPTKKNQIIYENKMREWEEKKNVQM